MTTVEPRRQHSRAATLLPCVGAPLYWRSSQAMAGTDIAMNKFSSPTDRRRLLEVTSSRGLFA